MINFLPVRVFLLSSFLALAASWAGAEEGGVNLKFVSFPKSLKPVELELLIGEGKTVRIKAPSNEISEGFSVPARSDWVVGETVSGEGDKPVFKALGEGRSAGTTSQIVLIVSKGKDRSDGFAVLSVDAGVNGFNAGKFLFLNASTMKIAGEVGARKFVLKPGGHSVISPREANGLCQAVLYYDKQGEARPFFSSRWPVSLEARAMIFIYQDPATKKLKLHSLREFME